MTTHCENCQAAFSDNFARVFGDNQNQIHQCPSCTTATSMGLGVAAGIEDSRARLASRGGAY